MVLSFFAVKQGALSFELVAWATIQRDAALVCLILYFLWQNGEPAERVGWIFKHFGFYFFTRSWLRRDRRRNYSRCYGPGICTRLPLAPESGCPYDYALPR
jgi:hypothetical protein